MKDPRETTDITGMVFGRLTVLGCDHSAKHKTYWRCRCECGKECVVLRYNLISGKTRSCGCLRGNSERIPRGHFRKVVLTERQTDWIIRHYKHTKNAEIKAKFNLTDGWLHRFARAYGLVKSGQFIRKCLAETAAKAKESHLRNGTYPPKGFIIPGSEKARFQKGHDPRDGMTEAEFRDMHRRIGEKRRETFRMEQMRVRWGLPQKTRMKVYGGGRNRAVYRNILRGKGYVVPRGCNDAYVSADTKRSPRTEATATKYGMHIIENAI